MANQISQKDLNIARPYALAAFEWARDKHALPAWQIFLEAATFVTQHDAVDKLLKNPDIETAQLVEFYQLVLASFLNKKQHNYLQLLALKKRLVLIPQIFALFNAYYDALQKLSKVQLTTAIDIEDIYKQKLIQALSKRIHHEVTLNCDIDPSILGGAIIQMGDRVLDASISGKLTRLLQNLTG